MCEVCRYKFIKSFVFSVTFFTTGQTIIDSRCYLDGGGSAESFIASEDLAVGSVIGNKIIFFFYRVN